MSRTCINSDEEASSKRVPMQGEAQTLIQINQNLIFQILQQSRATFTHIFEVRTFPHTFMDLKF